MKVTDRINILLENKGLTRYKFCKELGFSNGFLDGSRHIGTDKLEKTIEYFENVNPIWLISGEGDMYLNKAKPASSNPEPNEIYKSRTDILVEKQNIPLYEAEAVAGIVPVFQDLDNQEPLDYLSIPHAPKCDGAMYASGDSMYPIIKSGDILGYKEIKDLQNNIFWGQMYILYIDIEGEVMRTVKYVQKGKDKNYIKLVSENRHHEAKEICLDKITAMAQVKITVRIN